MELQETQSSAAAVVRAAGTYWPNLTDHYNGWNNIRYYYNDGSLFTKYREIYDGEDHDLRQKKEDNK